MKLILALAAITLLTACGGDDSNNTTQTPSAFTATVQSANQINLSWPSVSDANYYRLSSGDGEIYAGGNTSYNHEELEANTAYSYTLKSCTDSNSNTCSSASSAISATTQDDTQTTPQTPSAPTATVQGAYQIDLSWSAVSGASYYRLYNGSTEIYTNNGTSYNHEELEANTSYSYTLSTCTDSSINTCSRVSAAASATTTPQTLLITNKLNDTGVVWSGRDTGGNDNICDNYAGSYRQDCHYGRDASLTLLDGTFTYAADGSQVAKVGSGSAGFDFTKLSSTGATLSLNSTSWSCVQDNVTGLVWEVKTDLGASDTFTTNDDGVRTYTSTSATIHHKDNIYHWGGTTAIGKDRENDNSTYSDDWDVLVNGSNSENLCGFNDWRVPTIDEFESIVHRGVTSNIDTNYFPNNASGSGDYYWSSSLTANKVFNSWRFQFDVGHELADDNGYGEINQGRVRLVRREQ